MMMQFANDEELKAYFSLRRALLLGSVQEITPDLCDRRIEDGFARRKSQGDGPPVNLNDVCAALGLRDTRDVPFLKNATRTFCGFPTIGKLERVQVDENGAELPWVKGLRDRLKLPDGANIQTALRTAMAALEGDPWGEILGMTTSTLWGVREELENLASEKTNEKGRRLATVASVKAAVDQCLKNLREQMREGVPRVWIDKANETTNGKDMPL